MLTRIDAATSAVTGTVPLEGFPGAVAADGATVWAANHSGTLWRIDPETLQVEAIIEIGKRVAGLAVHRGVVWATVRDVERQAARRRHASRDGEAASYCALRVAYSRINSARDLTPSLR